MAWYSKQAATRRRQIWSDARLLMWIALWSVAAWYAHYSIAAIANPLRMTRQSIEGVRDHVHDAAVKAGALPVGGGQLRPPLDMLSADVNELVASLNTQIRAIETLATVSAVLMVLVPTVVYIMIWLPRRRRLSQPPDEPAGLGPGSASVVAGHIQSAPTGQSAALPTPRERLEAFRAMLTADPDALLAVVPDPVAALETNDVAAMLRMAAVARVERPQLEPGQGS